MTLNSNFAMQVIKQEAFLVLRRGWRGGLSSSEHRMESYKVHLQSLTSEFLGHLYLVFSLRLNISREFLHDE